jgi:hypothetical protein
VSYHTSISVGFKVVEARFGVTFVQSDLYQPAYSVCCFSYPPMPVITGEDPLHFHGELDEGEKKQRQNCCELVREL